MLIVVIDVIVDVVRTCCEVVEDVVVVVDVETTVVRG